MGNPESEVKCAVCRQAYSPDCDYHQGRCPNHPKKPFPTWLLLIAAPFIIAIWVVMNPKKFWEQVKKDLEL
jgi:hypothetical protein